MGARRQSGVSLIEIMVAMVIFGILIATGVPMFNVWMGNVQIRTASEAMLNGMQTARNDAIRTNRSIQFEITSPGGLTSYRVNPRSDPEADPAIRTRDHSEGSYNAQAVTTPVGATTVTFTALGRVDTSNGDGSPVMTQVDIDNPTMMPAESREMRIVIPPGGAIRMCDPQAVGTDPRRC